MRDSDWKTSDRTGKKKEYSGKKDVGIDYKKALEAKGKRRCRR